MTFTFCVLILWSMKTLGGLVELIMSAPAGYVSCRVICHEDDDPGQTHIYQDFRDEVLAQTKEFTSADFPNYSRNCARVYLVRMAGRGEIVPTGRSCKSATGNNKRLKVYRVAEITAPAELKCLAE